MTSRKSLYIYSIAAMLAIVMIGLITILMKPWNKRPIENIEETSKTVSMDTSIRFELNLPEDENLYQLQEGLNFSQLPPTPRMLFSENKLVARLSFEQIKPVPETIHTDDKLDNYMNSDTYVVFPLTGEHFVHDNPENYYVATRYTYDNAIKPLQDSLYEFVNASYQQVIYQVDVIYENPDDEIPKAFDIQCYSATDSGNALNIHILIFNV